MTQSSKIDQTYISNVIQDLKNLGIFVKVWPAWHYEPVRHSEYDPADYDGYRLSLGRPRPWPDCASKTYNAQQLEAFHAGVLVGRFCRLSGPPITRQQAEEIFNVYPRTQETDSE